MLNIRSTPLDTSYRCWQGRKAVHPSPSPASPHSLHQVFLQTSGETSNTNIAIHLRGIIASEAQSPVFATVMEICVASNRIFDIPPKIGSEQVIWLFYAVASDMDTKCGLTACPLHGLIGEGREPSKRLPAHGNGYFAPLFFGYQSIREAKRFRARVGIMGNDAV